MKKKNKKWMWVIIVIIGILFLLDYFNFINIFGGGLVEGIKCNSNDKCVKVTFPPGTSDFTIASFACESSCKSNYGTNNKNFVIDSTKLVAYCYCE